MAVQMFNFVHLACAPPRRPRGAMSYRLSAIGYQPLTENRELTADSRQPIADGRRGVALLVCLFVLSIVSVWVVNMFQSATVYQSALRNTVEYEQALYLANAGVHHAVAELEQDTSWRGTVSAGSYPASGSYSATAVNGALAGTVDVTSTGVAGEATRRLQATVLVN
jgi:Tfp pilus assembly protein PilX